MQIFCLQGVRLLIQILLKSDECISDNGHVAAEFILIVFRINEHLGAIRDQGQMQ